MSTQLSLKSTVKRSSRLNPTFKKKLGFQKLEIEFISKPKKRPRSDSKISPVLFDSQDDLHEKSGEVNQSKLDVKFTKSSVKNGTQLENANSQNFATSSAYETTQFAQAVPQSSAITSVDEIRKFINDGLNSQEFADEIKKLADGLNSQNFAYEIKKFTNDGLISQDFADEFLKLGDDGLNSQDFADEFKKLTNDSLNSQDFAYEIKTLANDGLESRNLTAEMEIFPNLDLNSQDFAPACTFDIESAKAKIQTLLKSKPVSNQRRALSCGDGNILPESFRKSATRVSKKSSTENTVIHQLPRSKNQKELVVPREINVSFKSAKNIQPVFATYKTRSRNKIEPVVPYKTSVSPAKNLQPTSEKKRGRKPRTSIAAKSTTKTFQNTFPTLLEPLNIEVASQKTKPYSRRPKPAHPNVEPVIIRRTRLSDKKQSALESAEIELCSLLSNCSVKSSDETVASLAGPSKTEIRNPIQNTNVSTTVFTCPSLSDLYRKDSDLANTDDLAELSDTFSMMLNVGNFSQNLNIMSLLRQVTKIKKILPHFFPSSENWYEDF
ncbi:hypothetical protein V9T40_005676 [Parthenolecanium corni]|uniref:Uncharacterized protein n=1 Tax=Parthenolecanium corni TaxID=536013 RepID=A0AAN9YB96_9HEMI